MSTVPEARSALDPYVLVLGTADWNQPIATNQHYVVRELCRDGFARVTFLESMALRRPQLRGRDIRRVLTRVRSAFGRRPSVGATSWRTQPTNLDVRSPLVIPIHRGLLSRPNGQLIRSTIHDWLTYDGPKVLWTYTPATYGLEHVADAAFYHCVDLLGTFPGIDSSVISHEERRLARSGVVAAATSKVVKSHLERQGFNDVLLWENVADIEAILSADPLDSHRVPGRVIFAGNLSPKKVDYGLLEALAGRGLDVCVAGPRAEGGGDDADYFESLVAHGVRYLGMLSITELAVELSRATVGLIPYTLNEYTRGVSPLKTFEYLSAGLAVVSTDIPGTPRSLNDIWVERTHAEFIERVASLAHLPTRAEIARRIATARPFSWTERGRSVRNVVTQLLRGTRHSAPALGETPLSLEATKDLRAPGDTTPRRNP